MCNDLESKAENYAIWATCDLDPDFITVGMVRQLIAEAYKQGRKDELNKLYDVIGLKPYIDENQLTDEDCQRTIDILAQTREGCRKATENIKDLTRLVSKQEFRNKLNHKDNESTRTTERARPYRQGT